MSTKVDLSKYNNSWYDTGKNAIVRFLWLYCNAFFLKSSWIPFSSIKIFILKLFGCKIGSGVTIKPCVNIKYPWLLTIGNNVWIGENVWIDNLADVHIGDNCCLSQGALLLTGNHNYKKAAFDLMVGKIILEDGVWISAKSMVGPGVSCRSHSVLLANSFATSDMEAYMIYGGSPAAPVKKRNIEK